MSKSIFQMIVEQKGRLANTDKDVKDVICEQPLNMRSSFTGSHKKMWKSRQADWGMSPHSFSSEFSTKFHQFWWIEEIGEFLSEENVTNSGDNNSFQCCFKLAKNQGNHQNWWQFCRKSMYIKVNWLRLPLNFRIEGYFSLKK